MSTILVTGANGNLGLAVVDHLLKEHYDVLTVSGKNAAGILPRDAQLKNVQLDLLDEFAAGEFIDQLMDETNDLQAAVLLVGGFAMGSIEETGRSELDKMISLNFYTAYNIVRPLLSHFQRRSEGGQIILIGSKPGLDASQGTKFFGYSLSKSMIFKLAEFINAEGKGKNITASVIVPSTIDTPANRKSMPDADFSKWVPAGNIAEAISFILSDTGRMLREGIFKVYNKA